ncbi:ribulose-phosphate 3-epimerase [Cellulomonas edaphi]|uniref:Ribulose-phosphate 3-epimerase n=1 Tax=Cellulomonas edaphi TaxID=3053468 RepID=A0ABT7S6E6_9CELL|nr:ribulose-phosphate 3-epimerase [Cellulomons edaphi]MDM7831192.1 ribulose-phosphate 3-epimerase [Cellulomons edaphi]
MPALINPSILSADFANLERDLGRIANADFAHVDVMDNHFVPNLTIGAPVVTRLAEVSPVPLDLHLMIEDADRWAPAYAEAGAASVTFHLEAAQAPVRLARELRAGGARVGVALRPATPVEPLLDLLDEIDMILVMTVEPGFGGQSFIEGTLPKIRRTRAAIDEAGADTWIQVDGGVARGTIARIAQAGANVFVAGSAVYGAEDPAAEIEELRRLAS